jgi:cyclopropane fatty-acyl-phospholipid synthase-like methyltransferase
MSLLIIQLSIGELSRKLLGPKYFKYAGRLYRNIFVDVKKVVQFFPEMPNDSHLLDIGGGDGDMINYIKERFPEVKISIIDIAESIGSLVEKQYKREINLFPGTSIIDYYNKYFHRLPKIDYILISDVIHHVKKEFRMQFFVDLKELVNENTVIIFKDIEPGYFISKLSYWADKYISNDKNVELTSKNEITNLMKENFPEIYFYETRLFQRNRPNFSLVFSLKQIIFNSI